jgi:hypothetical protein
MRVPVFIFIMSVIMPMTASTSGAMGVPALMRIVQQAAHKSAATAQRQRGGKAEKFLEAFRIVRHKEGYTPALEKTQQIFDIFVNII